MSDNLKSFLKSGSHIRIALVFLLGIAVIMFSGLGGGTPQSSDRGELSSLLSSVEGVGECEVMLSYGESGEVVAVAVICEGADSIFVRSSLTDLIGSLYGIGSNRISIVKSK